MFLIYRHGSNGANQPMTQTSAICFVDTDHTADAHRLAQIKHTVYNNQTLEARHESEVDTDEWNELAGSLPCYAPASEKRMPEVIESTKKREEKIK